MAILLTAWVLVVGPGLCQAGMIEHLCACPDCRPDCDDQACRDACTDDGCPSGHSCQGDPCDTRALRHRPVEAEDEARLVLQPLQALWVLGVPSIASPSPVDAVFLPSLEDHTASLAAQRSFPLLV